MITENVCTATRQDCVLQADLQLLKGYCFLPGSLGAFEDFFCSSHLAAGVMDRAKEESTLER